MKLIPQEVVDKLAEEYATKNAYDGYDKHIKRLACKAGIDIAIRELRNLSIDFLDSIREYERENGQRICFDERSSKELFDIFLNDGDGTNTQD